MELKLFDSERKVMEVLWEADAPVTAKEIAEIGIASCRERV